MTDSYFLIRYDYRRFFVCLQCRKKTEVPNISQMALENNDDEVLFKAFSKNLSPSEEKYFNEVYFERKHLCPSCQEPMYEVSAQDKIPKKKSQKWKYIQSFIRAKGYIRTSLPSGKKAFKSLLSFELECTQHRMKNIKLFKWVSETETQARERLANEENAIKNELNQLK